MGSLLVHGALVCLAMLWRSDRDRSRDEAQLAFIDVDATAEPVPRAEEPATAGGPAASAGPPAPAAPPAASPRRPVDRRAEPEDDDDSDEAEPSAISSASPRIAPRPAHTPAAGGIGADTGAGIGIGAGAGIGSGAGRGPARAGAAVRARRTALPPARSRARPARLVYPRRDREERPGEVFVVVLTVNEKGYVVGVRLEQGVSRDRDEKALDAVWRFHYDPALDRDGRPIESKVVQRFMVE